LEGGGGGGNEFGHRSP
jgi:hypothetical protein